MYKRNDIVPWLVFGMAVTVFSGYALGQSSAREILVIGTTPNGGLGQSRAKIPFAVQAAGSRELTTAQSLDLTDFLNSNMASVTLNAAQNNPLQPDLQFRGFSASPLLGVPQGIAVYQNGARINEPLGDAVNWDLLPESAIDSITLISGANPVFGLNTLGGALAIQMKNGFNFTDHQAEIYGGSWDRKVSTLESGANNGSLGYYINFSYFEEAGWRDLSASRAFNLYSSVSWRNGDRSVLDLSLQSGRSDLTGNGAAPVGLLDIDRKAIFTAPDITENNLTQISLAGSHLVTDDLQLSGSIYQRLNDTDSFNGDVSEFLRCQFFGGGEALLDEVKDMKDELAARLGIDIDSLCEGRNPAIRNYSQLEAFISNQARAAGLNPDAFNLEDISNDLSGSGILSDEGINNISDRSQTSQGLEGQLLLLDDFLQRPNRLIVGYSYFDGKSRFNSVAELSGMDAQTRSTAGLGVGTFFDEAATSINTRTRSWGLYFTDTLDLTERSALTLSARFNESDVTLRDLSGERPELNGDHRFNRLNPALGLTVQLDSRTSAYASYSESNRIPTPIELSCNESIFELARQYAIDDGEDPEDIEFECRLPNAFLADPPLNDVVTKNIEVGLRGNFAGIIYSAGVFNAVNHDDILFQTTGRATGLFAHVDKTRRRGFESSFAGSIAALNWTVAYSYIEATFESDFYALSPNHEFADADGSILVSAGDNIPGVPRQQLKLSVDYEFGEDLLVGLDAMAFSGQTLRGDESNQLDTLAGYGVVNLRGSLQLNEQLTVFARITNVFDKEYESFGLLGEDPTSVLDFISDDSPVFLGAGAPRGGWLGFRFRF